MQPRPLRYTLLCDGSSDALLRHPIEWSLRSMGWYEVEGEWADLRVIPDVGRGLPARIKTSLTHYAGELLFVHRDAEGDPMSLRVAEIRAAAERVGLRIPHVCVVPVRMTESWLLHDEAAIRSAAGRPHGNVGLDLPKLKLLEKLPDPKAVLRDALLEASEATGRLRRRKIRDFGVMRARVAELIADYGDLRALAAFERFEHELRTVLQSL